MIKKNYSKTAFLLTLIFLLQANSASAQINTEKYRKKKLENQGFLHLRGITHLSDRTNWEVFIQRQYDEFIDWHFKWV